MMSIRLSDQINSNTITETTNVEYVKVKDLNGIEQLISAVTKMRDYQNY